MTPLETLKALHEKQATAKRALNRSISDIEEYCSAVRHLNGIDSMLDVAARNALPDLLALAEAAQRVHEMDTATCGIREMGEALDALAAALSRLTTPQKDA